MVLEPKGKRCYKRKVKQLGKTYLFKVRRTHHLAHRLVKGIAYEDANIGSGEHIRADGERLQVLLRERIRRLANVHLQHRVASLLLGQWDVNALLKTSSNGGIQYPGNIRGAEHQNLIIVRADA